jgi:hypothetical protein
MAAVHVASMTFARRLADVDNIPQQDSAERAFNKLSALKEYRSKGEQKMTVQHVHIAEGGQAIVGNVNAPTEGGRGHKKPENNPMLLDMRQTSRCHAQSKRSGLQCRAPAVRRAKVCRMHGAGGGARKGNKNAVKHGAMVAESIAVRRDASSNAGEDIQRAPPP